MCVYILLLICRLTHLINGEIDTVASLFAEALTKEVLLVYLSLKSDQVDFSVGRI